MTRFSFPLHSVFLAVPLDAKAKKEFQRIQRALMPYEKIFWFQNPLSPHLTLTFWRSVSELEFKGVVQQAEKIGKKAKPFTMEVTDAGVFNTRVLFLSVHFSDHLARLKKACPWPPSTSSGQAREFCGHITLARMKHPETFVVKKKKIMKCLNDVTFTISVDRLRLYGMVEGKRQMPLRDFVLGGAD